MLSFKIIYFVRYINCYIAAFHQVECLLPVFLFYQTIQSLPDNKYYVYDTYNICLVAHLS